MKKLIIVALMMFGLQLVLTSTAEETVSTVSSIQQARMAQIDSIINNQ